MRYLPETGGRGGAAVVTQLLLTIILKIFFDFVAARRERERLRLQNLDGICKKKMEVLVLTHSHRQRDRRSWSPARSADFPTSTPQKNNLSDLSGKNWSTSLALLFSKPICGSLSAVTKGLVCVCARARVCVCAIETSKAFQKMHAFATISSRCFVLLFPAPRLDRASRNCRSP